MNFCKDCRHCIRNKPGISLFIGRYDEFEFAKCSARKSAYPDLIKGGLSRYESCSTVRHVGFVRSLETSARTSHNMCAALNPDFDWGPPPEVGPEITDCPDFEAGRCAPATPLPFWQRLWNWLNWK